MSAKLLTVTAMVLSLLGSLTPAQADDALDETLALVGLRRADLGWVPKGWWPRFPDPPYKLRAFDALFAAPLDTVTFARALAQTAWEGLAREALDADPQRGARSLYRTVQRLGIDPRFAGFRGYTANVLAPQVPVDQAIVELYRAAHRTTRPNTFGMELPYPKIEELLAARVKVLPQGVSPILGQLVLNIIDAHYWAELAFRKVDGNDRQVVATRYDVGEEMIDAFDYCPQIDDLARAWDEASLWYAGQKCVDALDLARAELRMLDLSGAPAFAFDWESPWGWIRVRGAGSDVVSGDDALLVVDLGGDDVYQGGVAASSATRPIGLLLDLAGNDQYLADGPAQGAGLCGIGVLIDERGDDTYAGQRYAQGVGQFGLGLCADLDGDDAYCNRFSGQGCGYFGVGLLLDVAGDDEYRTYGDGQGLGGVGGVGVLADRTGNDRYLAERKCSVTGRPSYHSPGIDVAVSNVQGCGMGRRGDGADGHCWAGGLGVLLDGAGNDFYSAGNWCMGTGYWFGIGILHDRGGNDEYHGAVYTQGTGAHFCIGVCIDEAGDDRHLAEENSNESLAWAHDFTIGLLLDAAGNDVYRVDTSGLAYSINRSIAMLIDQGGDDVYRSDDAQRRQGNQGLRPGVAINNEGFRARDGVSTYFADTTSLGLFLDIGGNDTYWSTELRNNSQWLDPPDSPNWADRNFSVGVDRAEGWIDFTPIPMRPPTGRAESPAPGGAGAPGAPQRR